jgi:hypothetical protein
VIGVEFMFDELISELRAIADMAGDAFLYKGDESKLHDMARQLLSLRRTKRTHTWALSEPIRTRVSVGEYQSDDEGAHSVYATLSWIWKITVLGSDRFALRGLSSTRVQILRHSPPQDPPLLTWVMDVADSASPGAHFHLQVKDIPPGDESEFDVPRIPGILYTPAEQLDFVLGELFLEAWPKHQQSHFASNQHSSIRECQRKRMSRIFGHLQEGLKTGAGASSAWMSLKSWKPVDLLLTGG